MTTANVTAPVQRQLPDGRWLIYIYKEQSKGSRNRYAFHYRILDEQAIVDYDPTIKAQQTLLIRHIGVYVTKNRLHPEPSKRDWYDSEAEFLARFGLV